MNRHYLVNYGRMFLVGRTEGRKEGNVLFNDVLNTFYFRLKALDIW